MNDALSWRSTSMGHSAEYSLVAVDFPFIYQDVIGNYFHIHFIHDSNNKLVAIKFFHNTTEIYCLYM